TRGTRGSRRARAPGAPGRASGREVSPQWSSEAPEHPHDLAEDLHVVGVDRLERGILRLQPHAAVGLAVEGLHGRLVRRLVLAGERDDDVAVPGLVPAL